MKNNPLSKLCDELSNLLKHSHTTETEFTDCLEQLTDEKSLSLFIEEKPPSEQLLQAGMILIKYMAEVIERGLTQHYPLVQHLESWLQRLRPVLMMIPHEVSAIFLTKVQRLLQAHHHYPEAIQVYHYGADAKLDVTWQSSQLALLTGITQQVDCTSVLQEQIASEIIGLLERSPSLMDNPAVWLDRWLCLKKYSTPVIEVSADRPIPWSQLIAACYMRVQYVQCMRWLTLLQARWQQAHATRAMPLAETIANTMHDLWARSRALALTLKRENEWLADWQTHLLMQLGALWHPPEGVTVPEEKPCQFNERWAYLQALLTQWYALLQLHWPTSWSTVPTDEKTTPLQCQAHRYLQQQIHTTKTFWQACLHGKPEEAYCRQLLQCRQLLCQAIRALEPKHRPLWAEQLQELLDSKLTEDQCHALASELPATDHEDVAPEWIDWRLELVAKPPTESTIQPI